jgi:peptidylprolyl isomerase
MVADTDSSSGLPLTAVDVVDVVATQPLPARASGTPVAPSAALPTVTLDANGKPSLAVSRTTAPSSLVVQPLIQGSGPAVTSGQTLVVHYTGWLWDGTQFDTTWDGGVPYVVSHIGQNQVIKGWDQGLVGQKVGSQVLLVVPPDLGYGSDAQGSIPANSTLVFVVDILAAK